MSVAIDCQKLSKRYGRSPVYALKDLNLQVKKGEIYGFLGPNGAGKSTTIRTLMNFIRPTAGRASILGRDIVRDSVAIKRSIGYLSSDAGIYPKMTGRQFLDYMSELQPADPAYLKELSGRLQADLDKRLADLSRGNRQKIAIIQTLMHQPAVLILDEPTTGLDPLMQEEFYKLLKEAARRGATVFTSSHILSEVQKLCDRVGIIRGGRLVAERSIADMAREASQTFDIVFAGAAPLKAFDGIKGVRVSGHAGRRVTLHVHGRLGPLFAELAKHDITKMDTRTLDLEEVFMNFYQDEEPANEAGN